MDNNSFNHLLTAFMVDDAKDEAPILKEIVYYILNEESRKRGFTDWVDAYHNYAK